MKQEFKLETNKNYSKLEVKEALSKIGLNLDKKKSKKNSIVILASGHVEMMPGQLSDKMEQLLPAEWSATLKSKSPFSKKYPDDKNIHKGTTNIGRSFEDTHFDVEQANTALNKLNAKLSGKEKRKTYDSGKESLQSYLSDIEKDLKYLYDLSQERAQKIIKRSISELQRLNKIPPLPDQDNASGDIDYSTWMAKAKSAGLKGIIMKHVS